LLLRVAAAVLMAAVVVLVDTAVPFQVSHLVEIAPRSQTLQFYLVQITP
jgi:hypothetical protein